jgi:putative membrane protein insertion efficiency factor
MATAFSVKRLLALPLLALIRAYQRWISPAFPRRCKYEPTCSAYAAQAVRELGPLRGSVVAGWRLLRCNPLSDGGIDDLEDRRLFRSRASDREGRHGRARASSDSRSEHLPPAGPVEAGR